MNKEQQIEEMGKVMPEKIKDPLDNSRYIIFGKSLRREIARIYYNAGYRKVSDSEAEIERVKEQLAEFKKPVTQFIKDRETQAVKEFAEKLKAKAVQEAEAEDYVCYIVDRLLKEYEK